MVDTLLLYKPLSAQRKTAERLGLTTGLSARMVLTDSGGIQDEATVLGIPLSLPLGEYGAHYHS